MQRPSRVRRQAWFGPLCLFAGSSAFVIQAHYFFTRGFFSWKHAAGALSLFVIGAFATFYTLEEWWDFKSPTSAPNQAAEEEEVTAEEFNRRFENLD